MDAGVALGWDTHVNNNLVLGIGGTYSPKATIHFKPYGTSVGALGTYQGFEVGGYGRYDAPDSFYLEGSGSYGSYNDTTHRFVSLPNPSPPPTNNSGFVNGKFTSGVWALYGEGGVPLDTGGDLRITPYAAVAYLHSSSGSYQEHIQTAGMIGTLPSPVALHVSDASATSLSSYLGVQFGTNWALSADTTLLPSLKLAWVHEFDGSMWQVNAAFPGVPGSGFTVNGAFLGKDSGLVDASVAVALTDNLAASFGYEGRLSSTTTDNMVLGRLTLTFGEEAPPPPPPAPPPPPPAPPPPPVKTFIVFFDFDKSNITPEADSVVSEAVKTAKEGGTVKMLITGHTDTVGSDSYNQGLSVRRANAVKTDMVQKGMDGSEIAIEGKSFHDPLVATGPGVREPQNRRAVIDLGG
jgi:outer membrane protein OmpA-like peptidoglycan-associated protein